MKSLTILTAAALALAACDSGGTNEAAPANVTSIKVDGGYVARMKALSQQQRDLALRRAVIDSGNACHRVRSSEEAGTHENLSVWNITCDNGEWAVFVGPMGDVQVRSCAHVRELGLPGCGAAATEETPKPAPAR